VPERVRHDGTIGTRLDEQAVREAARALHQAGVKSVAVCFLYGFVRSEHEEIDRPIVAKEFPDAVACASYEVSPKFREYKRMATTVVNAYLGPVMQGYIRRLAERLSQSG
jgi:N-methylhydantoinase A